MNQAGRIANEKVCGQQREAQIEREDCLKQSTDFHVQFAAGEQTVEASITIIVGGSAEQHEIPRIQFCLLALRQLVDRYWVS